MAFLYEHPGQMQELNSEMPIDRISGLPDELLINILNFLPTKYAFITTTLSRRWSYLLKEVTHLDLDDSLLFNQKKSCVSFRDFVFKMLDYLKLSNLISFRFKCSAEGQQWLYKNIGLWLDAILSHRIQEIDLCSATYIVLPDSIFTCQTLCILKLTISGTITAIPDTVCLPCLKILHLRVFDVHSISRIFSRCPLLQEFYTESSWYKADGLSISGPSLRKLKLGRGQLYCCHPMDFVTIVSPLLQCFHYSDKLASYYSIMTSNYLVEAHLDTSGDFGNFVDLSAVSNSARDLVQGVSNVKRLFLSGHCIEVLTLVKDELPVLRNLTKLKIGCPKDPQTLLRFLGSAPFLEVLIFSEGLFPAYLSYIVEVQKDYWESGKAVPSCLKTHLKVIEIEHLTGLKEELRIVGFFLETAMFWNS